MSKTISPQDAAALLSGGEAILIDVREPDEFRDTHIAYAISLPLSNLQNLFEQLHIPATRKLIFQCFKGKRGEQACVNIQALGACKNEIYNLEGGIEAWKNAGLPVISGSAGLSIFRQVQIIVGGCIVLLTVLGAAGLTFSFFIAGFLGAALFFSGLTGWCGLAMLLKKMPWNK